MTVKVVNLADPTVLLEKILIDGRKPDFFQLHAFGLDVRYLEKIVDMTKNRLWELPEYRPLKEFTHSGRPEQHQKRFTEASIADTPCLRIGYIRRGEFSGRSFFESLLKIYPKDDLSTYARTKDIELFVTFRAEWILYDGRNMSDAESFTVCRSVQELKEHLESLTTDTHVLKPAMDTVLMNIAHCLINTIRNEVDRLQKNIDYHQITLRECDVLQDRMNAK